MTTPRRCGMATLLWLIDDSPSHQQVTAATVATQPEFTFTGFLSAPAGLSAFHALLKTPEKLPDIVLMDFYIGPDRGDRVTTALRKLAPPERALTIVGFSSMRSGSEAIAAAGGDVIVRKHADAEGFNPTLWRWLRAWTP